MIAFSQRDVKWRDTNLGHSDVSIGKAGCLLCSVAAMLAECDVDTDPWRLNKWLMAHGGYQDGNLFRFASIAPLGVRLVQVIRCRYQPAPLVEIRDHLSRHYQVLALVDWQPGADIQPHWVRLLECTDTAGVIMDPWQLPGDERQPLSRYLAPGWNVARGVFGAAIYEQSCQAAQERLSYYSMPRPDLDVAD